MASKPHGPVIGDGSLHIGDRVVYPNQGICKITGVETKTISGMALELVTLSREEDGATVMVPKAKVMTIGLRKVAQAAEVEKIFDMLASIGDDPQLDWKVRHRENAERMSGGGLMGTVEVLKGLHSLARVRPLPAKERELYDNARHLLVVEIAAAMSLPIHVAEDNLDYALWPPEGMKWHGKVLPPATLGPPTPVAKAAGDDDDLGFEDEEAAEEPAAAVGAKEEEEGEEEEEAPAAKPAAAPKAPKAPKAAPAPKAAAAENHGALKHAAPAPKAAPAAAENHAALKHAAPAARHAEPAAKHAEHAPKHAEHAPKHAEPAAAKHAEPKHAAPKAAHPAPKAAPAAAKKAAAPKAAPAKKAATAKKAAAPKAAPAKKAAKPAAAAAKKGKK